MIHFCAKRIFGAACIFFVCAAISPVFAKDAQTAQNKAPEQFEEDGVLWTRVADEDITPKEQQFRPAYKPRGQTSPPWKNTAANI